MALVLFRYTLWYTINISESDADLPSTHPTDLTRAKHHASRYYTVSQKKHLRNLVKHYNNNNNNNNNNNVNL